jgi:hypothetical protein
LFEQSYVGANGGMEHLRTAYAQASDWVTVPLMEFQRTTGRLDDHHFFASAANQSRAFRDQVDERLSRRTPAERQERDATLFDLGRRIELIVAVHSGYFNPLHGTCSYRLTVPADAPATQRWAAVVLTAPPMR